MAGKGEVVDSPDHDQKALAEDEAEDEMSDAQGEEGGAAAVPAVESEVNQERW